LRSAIIR